MPSSVMLLSQSCSLSPCHFFQFYRPCPSLLSPCSAVCKGRAQPGRAGSLRHCTITKPPPAPALPPRRGWQPVAKPERKRCWNGIPDPKHLPLRCSSTSGCKILLLQPLKYTRLPCCHGVGLQEYRWVYGNIQIPNPNPPGPLFVGTEQIKALRTAALVDSEIQGCCLLWELLVMLLCLNSGLGRVLMGDQWCPVLLSARTAARIPQLGLRGCRG